MKKLFRYSFALVAGALLLAGCEMDNKHAIYTGPDGVAFNAASWSVEAALSDTSFDVPLNRGNADGALTVEIKTGEDFKGDIAEIFTVPLSATFAPGEYTTMIQVGMNTTLMQPGTTYRFTLSSSDPSVSADLENKKATDQNAWDPPTYRGTAITTVQCVIPLTWEPWATGTYTGWYSEQPNKAPTSLQKAVGLNVFRLVTPYNDEVYDGLYSSGGDYIFDWNIDAKETSISPWEDFIQSDEKLPAIFTGLQDSNGFVYWMTDTDPNWTYYDPATQTFTINSLYGVFSSKTDAGYLGYYGWGDDFFVITEFLQGNPWN